MKLKLSLYLTIFCISLTSHASPLIHSQYIGVGDPGGPHFYALSADSGVSSKFIYSAVQTIPPFSIPAQDPVFLLRAYELNSTTGQYVTMDPFVAGGGGALYTPARYIKIGLAKPAATILQHFYFLSKSGFDYRIGWASVNSSTGKISTIAGILTQGSGGVQGLSNATEMVITPGLTTSYLYTTGSSEDVIGIFSRNMTTGALTYVGVAPTLTPALSNPKSLTLNEAGTRLAVASDNRLTIFNINAGGTLTMVHDLRGDVTSCVQDIADVVLTNSENLVFVSAPGRIRRLVRSAVTFTWSCASQFAPAFWEDATVRIAAGDQNTHIIASAYGAELDSVASLDWSSAASVIVLSDIYNTILGNYFLKPGPAIVTKDKQKVMVGNLGTLINFDNIDGMNVFRVDDRLFVDGFE